MKIYKAKSIDRKTFVVQNENGEELSKLNYAKWYSINAEIITNSRILTVKPKNVLETSIYVIENDEIRFIFKMNFRREILIKDMRTNKKYKLKSKGIVNSKLRLYDAEKNLIAQINPEFIKKTFNFNFEMKVNNKFETIPDKDIFVPLIFHCCNYVIDIYIFLLSKSND